MSPFGYAPDFQESNPLLDTVLKLVGLPILPRRFQARSVFRMLKPFGCNKSIVDMGCGNGIFCLELAKRGYGNVVGIDVSIDKITLAKKRAHLMCLNDKISLVMGDIQYAPLVSESFDEVLCNCVLEHVQDDEKALNEVRRVLKRGGTFVLTVPSKTPRILLPIWKFWAKCPKLIRRILAPPFLYHLEDPTSFEKEFWKYKQTRFNEIRNYSLKELSYRLEEMNFQLTQSEYNLKLFGAAMWNLVIGLKPIHLNRGMALVFPFMYAISLIDELLPRHMNGEEFAISVKKLV